MKSQVIRDDCKSDKVCDILSENIAASANAYGAVGRRKKM